MNRSPFLPRSARRAVAATAIVLPAILLAACVPPEERAEDHYQEALQLVAAGDTARAKIELRNVFDLDGFHRDARDLYAEIVLAEGRTREAYGQTLRLIEQYPEDVEGRRRLALMAVESRQWDEVRVHSEAGLAVDPEDPGLRAAAAALSYFEALRDDDEDAAIAASQEAGRTLAEDPTLQAARLVMIDRMGREGRIDAALRLVEDGIAQDEDDLALRRLRVGLLAQTGDEAALDAELADVARRFPEDAPLVQTYIRWLVSRERLDEAEGFLRERADAGGWEDRLTLLQFLRQTGGAEAMRAELDALLADPEVARRPLLRTMRAELDFEAGATEEAVAEMIALTETLGDEADGLDAVERARLHLSLARMQRAQGDRVGARAALERALEVDPTLAAAHKMLAVWAIEADDPAAAITALRNGLGSAPRDPEIMSLMAQAHLLNGDQDLAGEMLARAVELSNAGPEESLRYAEFLTGNGRIEPAAAVIADARRITPDDLRLISAAGQIMIRQGSWLQLDEVIEILRERPEPAAATLADEFTAQALAAQNRDEELQTLLSDLAGAEGAAGLQAQVALLRSELAGGDIEAALDRAEGIVETVPENAQARVLLAGTLAAANRVEDAEATLREATRIAPERAEPWLALFRLTAQRDGMAAADPILDEALAAVPDSGAVLLQQAGRLEREGRIEEAIAVYERLYEAERGSLVIANNLASLIGMFTDEPAEIERAERIARRLRASDVPAFQDTYGWLAYRTGDVETALRYLEPAAEGLPQDPFVRFHLARAQIAAGRPEAAETLAEARALLEPRIAAGFDPEVMAELEARIDAAEAELAAAPPPATD